MPNKCLFCGIPGHRVRKCNHVCVEMLCRQIDETEDVNIFLHDCKSVELSILMIHKYGATNVSITKSKKIEFILQHWTEEIGWAIDLEPTISNIDIYNDDENQTQMQANEIGEEIVVNLKLIFEAFRLANSPASQFIDTFRETHNNIIHHPRVYGNAEFSSMVSIYVSEEITQYVTTMDLGYMKNVETPIQCITVIQNSKCSNKDSNIECIICYDEFPETVMVTLNCDHQLCSECMIKISNCQTNPTIICPYCRGVIDSIKIHDEDACVRFATKIQQLPGYDIV